MPVAAVKPHDDRLGGPGLTGLDKRVLHDGGRERLVAVRHHVQTGGHQRLVVAADVDPLLAVVERVPLHARRKRIGQSQRRLARRPRAPGRRAADHFAYGSWMRRPAALGPIEHVRGAAQPQVADAVDPGNPQFRDLQTRIGLAIRDAAGQR